MIRISNSLGVRQSIALLSRAIACLAVIVVISVGRWPAHAEPVSDAAALAAGIKAVKGDLTQLANDAFAAGDQVLYNRIEQTLNGLNLILPKLDGLLGKAEGTANEIVSNASRETVALLQDLHSDASNTGNFASAKLNQGLASASSLLASVPFVNVPPAVFAVSPTRIEASQKGRRVRIFGYLPGELNKDVKISVNGKHVDAQRAAGGSIAFNLPMDLPLVPEKEISISMEVTEHYGWFDWLWKTHSFKEVLLVGKDKPFTCTVEGYNDNPNYLQKVVATGTRTFDASTQAGQNRPNEDRTINAEDLFAATMGQAASAYDPKSVVVLDTGFVFHSYGECGGKGPHGSAEILSSGKQVRVLLSAPSLPDFVVWSNGVIPAPKKVCHAGGTHGVGTLTPVFMAALKTAQPLVLAKTSSHQFGTDGLDVAYPIPAAAPWSVHTKCNFKEGSESWSTRTMVLTPKDTQESARGMTARIADGRLLIDRLDPLKFDDQLR